MLTLPALLLLGVAGSALECKPSSIEQVRILAPHQLRTLDPQPGANCIVAVELPPNTTQLTVLLRVAAADYVVPAPLPPTLLDTSSAVNADSSEAMLTFRVPSRQTQTLSLNVIVGGRQQGSPRRVVQVPLYLMRPPELSLGPPPGACAASGVCLRAEGATMVLLTGSGLEEVRTGAKAAKFKPALGGGPLEFEIVTSDPHVGIRVPRSADLPAGRYELEISTRSPYFRQEVGAGTTPINGVALGPFMVEHETVPTSEIRFSDRESGETTVFVGETMPVRVALSNGQSVPSGTYRVLEGIGDEGKEVALLDVLNGTAARIVGITKTREPFRRTSLAEVSVVQVVSQPAGGSAAPAPRRYHAHLQVVPAPVVKSTTVQHTQIAAYDGPELHPGERATVVLQGETLRAYDRIDLPPASGILIDSIRTDHQITLELTVDRGAQGYLPLTLSSDLVRDTVLQIPIAPAQRPRPLTFVKLDREVPGERFLHIFPRSKRESVIVGNAPAALGARDLTRIGLRFDRGQIDDGELYGPQYLVVTVELRGEDGNTVRADSARIAVLPEKGDGYVLASGYRQLNELLLDELLRKATRYAGPGTTLRLAIRHDEPRYRGRKGSDLTVSITNEARFRVMPRLDLLAGLTYFAEVPSTDAARRIPLPNGPSTDTLVRPNTDADWKVDLFDVTGGASAAVDVDYLNGKGLPSLVRLRLAFLVVSDPFHNGRKRRLGGALLYPIELYKLDGGLSLSLAIGYGHLVGGRGFGIIVPGVGFALPQL